MAAGRTRRTWVERSAAWRHRTWRQNTVSTGKSKDSPTPRHLMIVNDDPGVECRIAIIEDGRLEELYTERTSQATGVGNIYKGKVVNVESAIQAAFVEYGGPQRGFLHVTDLHPRYFPGKDKTEQVGKKVARKARPPIQDCLKKGDEILVQVLKEGLGTKGPTLTSYLSVPGRLAVMMPYMDKVGVSRKIEDEDLRRKIREKLDALNLPEGFGFILRTAGMDRTQTEIKRDIAYLLRLWKVMEKRIEQVGAPCLLYNESDLLVRTIRDVLRPSIDAVVVDSASGHERISAFLKVAAPRSAPNIIRYGDPLPLFHAFDIEKQIEQIHGRDVDLPSGGRLVIDQTEALVSIDVNSGRSRRARDSETNAYRTNMEACDEICRQLRLRDLGGLIVNDLIDMSLASHRKTVENKFLDNLERDRARTSILPISRFGLLQMTRQRMRPSVLDSHYVGCSHCAARGQVKSPEQVAADASRHAGWLLRSDRIRRIEIACSPAVASVLMSHRRRELDGYEDATGKRIVVRVSVSIATDHVAYFAYDERGADVDASTIPLPKPPTLDALIEAEKHIDDVEGEDTGDKGRRRRRGRRTPPAADATSIALGGDFDAELASLDKKEEKPKRQRRGGSSREKTEEVTVRVYELAKKLGVKSKEIIDKCGEADIEIRNHMSSLSAEIVKKIESLFSVPVAADATDADEGDGESTEPRKRRRRRRGGRRHRKSKASKDAEAGESEKETGEAAAQETAPDAEKKEEPAKKPRRRRSSGRKKAAGNKESGKKKSTRKKTAQKAATKDLATKVEVKAPPSTGRRTLYGAGRRSITSSEAKSSRREGE